ncbi:MAG: hypothetical protein WA734_15305 [Candidatus Acidiferrales bacterium]
MPTTQVRIVQIKKWFPTHDPLAATIARLCILREDMLLEMEAVFRRGWNEQEDERNMVRRMYFLRNLIRTQAEVSSGIRALMNSKEFRAVLRKQPAPIRKAFTAGLRPIDRVHPIAQKVRNSICGHVLQGAVAEALRRISPDSFGLLEVNAKERLTHFRFAGELVAEMLLEDVPEDDRRKISSSKYAAIADLVEHTFGLMAVALRIYALDRGLWP